MNASICNVKQAPARVTWCKATRGFGGGGDRHQLPLGWADQNCCYVSMFTSCQQSMTWYGVRSSGRFSGRGMQGPFDQSWDRSIRHEDEYNHASQQTLLVERTTCMLLVAFWLSGSTDDHVCSTLPSRAWFAWGRCSQCFIEVLTDQRGISQMSYTWLMRDPRNQVWSSHAGLAPILALLCKLDASPYTILFVWHDITAWLPAFTGCAGLDDQLRFYISLVCSKSIYVLQWEESFSHALNSSIDTPECSAISTCWWCWLQSNRIAIGLNALWAICLLFMLSL